MRKCPSVGSNDFHGESASNLIWKILCNFRRSSFKVLVFVVVRLRNRQHGRPGFGSQSSGC